MNLEGQRQTQIPCVDQEEKSQINQRDLIKIICQFSSDS